MTLHEAARELVILGLVSACALALAVAAVIMCFSLLRMVNKPKGNAYRGGWLRLDGSALHGRIVFVDDIGWGREIARWGLDSNGYMAFDQHSDQTLYTGYLIEGASDIHPSLRTSPDAPYRPRTTSDCEAVAPKEVASERASGGSSGDRL